MRVDSEVFDKALEKLWIHGGALVDYAENVSRGADGWREPYMAQGEHKAAQIELMIRFTESGECRMLSLVRHFGDYEDAREPCGICDFCAPAGCVAQRYREATAAEREAAARVIAALRAGDGKSTGRLHTEVFADKSLDRRAFEQLLCDMARAGLLRLADATFEKDGKRIDFRKAHLTRAGREWDGSAALEIREPVRGEPRLRKGGRKKAAARAKTKPEPKPRAAKAAPAAGEASSRNCGRGAWRRRASAVCRPSVS